MTFSFQWRKSARIEIYQTVSFFEQRFLSLSNTTEVYLNILCIIQFSGVKPDGKHDKGGEAVQKVWKLPINKIWLSSFTDSIRIQRKFTNFAGI